MLIDQGHCRRRSFSTLFRSDRTFHCVNNISRLRYAAFVGNRRSLQQYIILSFGPRYGWAIAFYPHSERYGFRHKNHRSTAHSVRCTYSLFNIIPAHWTTWNNKISRKRTLRNSVLLLLLIIIFSFPTLRPRGT